MPAIAPAALVRIAESIEFIPAMSTTEYIVVMSESPVKELMSPAAMVETIIFGNPVGSAEFRIALLANEVPPLPPIEITPCREERDSLEFMNGTSALDILKITTFRGSSLNPAGGLGRRVLCGMSISGWTTGVRPTSARRTVGGRECSDSAFLRKRSSDNFVSQVPNKSIIGLAGVGGSMVCWTGFIDRWFVVYGGGGG